MQRRCENCKWWARDGQRHGWGGTCELTVSGDSVEDSQNTPVHKESKAQAYNSYSMYGAYLHTRPDFFCSQWTTKLSRDELLARLAALHGPTDEQIAHREADRLLLAYDCGSCRWFDSLGDSPLPTGTWRLCNRTIAPVRDALNAIPVGLAHTDDTRIAVPASFGCVQWEVKE